MGAGGHWPEASGYPPADAVTGWVVQFFTEPHIVSHVQCEGRYNYDEFEFYWRFIPFITEYEWRCTFHSVLKAINVPNAVGKRGRE